MLTTKMHGDNDEEYEDGEININDKFVYDIVHRIQSYKKNSDLRRGYLLDTFVFFKCPNYIKM